MATTGSRDLITSILIMAGIPLAFSVACSLLSTIKEKKQHQIQQTEIDSMRNDVDDDQVLLKDQILTLRCKTEELQNLERDIEVRFLRYIELKDQEYALMEVQNGLRMEKERAEFSQREVASMEEEKRKFDEMVVEYLKALKEVECSRVENNVLRRREKKLLRKMKQSLRLIVKQKLKIEAQEADMSSRQVELERKEIVIGGFEREVDEMRTVIDRLENEKNEVMKTLEITNNTVASKAEAERVLTENYNRVVNELESIKKDRAAELKELIYLRWCHACLRHELARRKELEQEAQRDEQKVNTQEVGLEVSQNVAPEECKGHDSDNEGVVRHDESFFGPGQQHTKRGWLVRKFKKWVEGNDHKHHEAKCFGSHSCVDETEDRHSVERKSFSSV
ncbi:hypothetical protein QVD17_23150 [Tagetes erecta]|uniref:Uncharacterized protein n=1 Tax=Tagetes erecta TaxID=13708 RepID=A0AAD8NU37_TARER|nr:hypothetical protein QVD17_23150 [Tagetes erecta]